MTDPVLDVRELTVTYPNGFRALDGITLTIPEGGRLGLVGASGCGKTTLIRAVLGLLPRGAVVEGSVTVAGNDVLRRGESETRALRGTVIGYVSQDPYAACDPLRRVRHHVEEAWTAHRLKPPPGAVVQGLSGFGIDDADRRAGQRPHQWSGGMLQRATTLAATVHRPLVTLADEPTSALDTELADSALRLLRRTCRALLLVSHDLALVARHAEEVVVLDAGRVVERDSSATVFATARHEATATLVRASAPPPLTRAEVRTEPVVELRDVERRYRHGGSALVAVAGVDLTLRRGEVVGVVGRSGSGKSTLLRLASGQERPDAGEVRFEGAPAWNGPRPALPRAGWAMPVFQDPVASLDRRWPLWRTVTEPLVVTGARLSRAERRDRARAELGRVGLAHVDVNRLPGTLSVGQCQRIALVRALIARPAVLVADEPTASLDVHAAAAVAQLIRAAADDDGAAVLVVSHDEIRLASYADRLVRMRDGALAQLDPEPVHGTGSRPVPPDGAAADTG